MGNFINDNFKGSTVTLAVTGLPMTITGEIVCVAETNIITVRTQNGNKIYINAELIAFVF